VSWKLLDPAPGERVYAVIGEPGDDAVDLLDQFARRYGEGHLLAGEVWPTLEVIVGEAPGYLRKTQRPGIGLTLVDLGVSRGGDR
jgi:predicted DNA-binding protein with PD1-like motif